MNSENMFDSMISNLNATNDDFINNYFDEEFEKSIKQEEIEDFIDESINNNEETNEVISELQENNNEQVDLNLLDNEEITIDEKPKLFSYNKILDRLDKKEKIDINNCNDILNLIGNSNNSEEFFEILEKVSKDDK